jgi:hypothetical protein
MPLSFGAIAVVVHHANDERRTERRVFRECNAALSRHHPRKRMIQYSGRLGGFVIAGRRPGNPCGLAAIGHAAWMRGSSPRMTWRCASVRKRII